jgi:hypothetical protein
MSTQEWFLVALGLSADSEIALWMLGRGVALADEETMAQAIHDVSCRIAADHDPAAAD